MQHTHTILSQVKSRQIDFIVFPLYNLKGNAVYKNNRV